MTVGTARICPDEGIDTQDILAGAQVEGMSDDELASEEEKRAGCARLTPLQKTRIVQALQKNGHMVSFLGDGINNAPPLRDESLGMGMQICAKLANSHR